MLEHDGLNARANELAQSAAGVMAERMAEGFEPVGDEEIELLVCAGVPMSEIAGMSRTEARKRLGLTGDLFEGKEKATV